MVELQRNLGLSAVFTVSLGAMIGSGIFVLPGLAAELAGPAVILAYLIAGLVVIPAAVSKSELATAMPRAGGAYLFIDRAMGPLVGTVAGFGVWFALVFKSAFAWWVWADTCCSSWTCRCGRWRWSWPWRCAR